MMGRLSTSFAMVMPDESPDRKAVFGIVVVVKVSSLVERQTYPEEIRADNALYNQAKLYETQLNDPEKAKACYEKLFMEFTDSTFSIDARKRFRELRGDFDEPVEEMQ